MEAIKNILRYRDRKDFLKSWYRERPFLTAAHLKYIAIITMLLSHISQTGYLYMFGPDYYKLAGSFTLIGRLAMPIFCFFTVQAVIFTKDIKKYLLRMLIFAGLSEIPFNLAFSKSLFDPYRKNVMFTLLIGALAIYGMDYIWKSKVNGVIKILLMAVIAYMGCLLADFMHTDYSSKGVLAIILLYLAKDSRTLTALALLVAFKFEAVMPGGFTAITYGVVYLSIPLIVLYNAQKGKQNRWAFYFFYPAHLMILYILMEIRMQSFI